jgi:hypothetical protein
MKPLNAYIIDLEVIMASGALALVQLLHTLLHIVTRYSLYWEY